METKRLATYKKNAKRLGAHIVFVDESGFLLIPPIRKTWAPRGNTPIHRHHYRREKVSAISGISLSPSRRRCGLYFNCHVKNIQHAEVSTFLLHLLKHLRGHIIVIWDNATIHKGEPFRAICSKFHRLRLERLPPYAPELNPDEGVWNHTDRKLANGRPDDRKILRSEIASILGKLRSLQPDLRACFHKSDLPLFLP